MAPEVLQGATDMNAVAFICIDVYAAALVTWELLSRCSFAEGGKENRFGRCCRCNETGLGGYQCKKCG